MLICTHKLHDANVTSLPDRATTHVQLQLTLSQWICLWALRWFLLTITWLGDSNIQNYTTFSIVQDARSEYVYGHYDGFFSQLHDLAIAIFKTIPHLQSCKMSKLYHIFNRARCSQWICLWALRWFLLTITWLGDCNIQNYTTFAIVQDALSLSCYFSEPPTKHVTGVFFQQVKPMEYEAGPLTSIYWRVSHMELHLSPKSSRHSDKLSHGNFKFHLILILSETRAGIA
jgi:hypothetical protein